MDAVSEFRKRRAERIAEKKYGADREAVEAYRKRRAARLDAKWEENEHPRDENGKFTSGGFGASKRSRAYHHDPNEKGGGNTKSGSEFPKIKGVTHEKKEAGFVVPVFDEATFTENFEEKKKIAREAAKRIVPEIRKTFSTKVNDIKRPEVNDDTIAYLKKSLGNVTQEQIEKGLEEAGKIYSYWEKNEPVITETVVGAVKGVGGTMFGLDNRIKFDKSLAKKAIADANNPLLGYDGNVERASANIKDGIRYTAVFESDNFVEGYKKVKEALEKMGIREYRCKNFFKQYREQDGSDGKIGEQKSVQCVFETPDGKKFELQFHTPESMAAKEVNHPTYKQKKEPESEYVEFNQPRSLFMRDTSSVVPDPDGVFDIEEHKRGETGYKQAPNKKANP